MRGMSPRFRFSIKSALLLTFWTAVWFANLYAVDWYEALEWEHTWLVYSIYFGLIMMPPAAVVGIICGHPWTGLLCGLACAFSFTLAGWASDFLSYILFVPAG